MPPHSALIEAPGPGARPRRLRERLLAAAIGGPLLVAAAAVFTLLLPDAGEIAPSLRLQLIAVTVGGMVLAALIMLWIVGLFRRDLGRLEAAARDRLQRTQAALHESEARYAQVVEGSEDGIFDWDFLRDRHYLSPRLKAMLGFSGAGLPERREVFQELVHPDDRGRETEVLRRHIEHDEPYLVEHRLRRTDGRYLWVRVRGAAVRGDDNSVIRVCGTITDISAERAVNERVAALLEQQRAVYDNAVAGIARVRRGVLASCNRRFAELLGHSPDALIGCEMDSLYAEAPAAQGARPLAGEPGGAPALQREVLLRRADASRAWFLVSASAADPASPGADMVWVMVDIDDRKRAELALRENEARLYHAIKGSSDAIWDWDLRSGRYYMSPRMRELLGEGYGDPVNDRAWFLERLHPEDRARLEDAVRRHLEDGEPYAVEYRMRADDGGYRWIRARGSSVRDADGRAVRFSGANTDITAAREAADRERALRAEQKAVFDNDLVGIARLRERVIVSCNARFAAMFGYAREALIGRSISTLYANALDFSAAAQCYESIRLTGSYQSEHAYLHASGRRVWCAEFGHAFDREAPERDSLWMFTDIDERKRAELALLESDARYRAFIAASHEAILRVEYQPPVDTALAVEEQVRRIVRDGRIVECNQAFARAHGCSGPEAVVGRPQTDFIDAATLAVRVREMVEADYRLERVEWQQRFGRESRWFESSTVGVVENGRLMRSWSARTDITARKRAEQASDRAREFSEALVSVQPGLFLLVGRDGRLALWNRNAERVTGYAAAELTELGVQALIAPEDHPRLLEAVRATYRQGTGTLECDLVAKDGTRLPHFWSARRWDSGGERYLVATATDLSERLNAEREIRLANQTLEQRVEERTGQLQRANRDLEAFSYTVSHDLSAPLRAIDGFAALLEDEAAARLAPQARSHLDRIRASARQMRALIDDLLRLARVSREALDKRDIDLAPIARRVAEALAAQHPERRVEFVAPESLPAHGDARLLEIALTNLLGNAWKFTARAAQPRVELCAEEADGQTAWIVRDNGAGLDMRYAERLFKPFQRLHSAHEFEGTGIGLAIVHSIVERHGGRIRVDSAPGQGAAFRFTLD